MSFLVPANSRSVAIATDTITSSDLQGGSVGYSTSCTVTVPQSIPAGRGCILFATADGVVITISVGGADTVSGSPVTLNTNQAIRLSKTTSTAWRLLQSGSVVTGYTAFASASVFSIIGTQSVFSTYYSLTGSLV